MFLQGSASESSFSFPSGECITGVSSDSSCALSLLSNQTWSSRNRSSGTGLGNSMNIDGAPVSQCNAAHSVTVAHYPSSSSSWGYKDNNDSDCGFHGVPSGHLGLGQISQPHFSGQFHGDHLMEQVQDGGRQYMDVDHSRAYNSGTTNHVDWSLWLFSSFCCFVLRKSTIAFCCGLSRALSDDCSVHPEFLSWSLDFLGV